MFKGKKVFRNGGAGSVKRNILVTSVSKKVPMINSIRRAGQKLGNSGRIIGADLNEDCISRYFVDEFWKMPALDDFAIEDLISRCTEREISAIIPSRDGELLYFSKHREELGKKGIRVMVSEYDAVQTCLDKLMFYRRCREIGFPVIVTETDLNALPEGTCVVKERYGAGSQRIGLDLTGEEALRHAATLQNPVYQPYIAGTEISVDLYVDAGEKTKGAILRRREVIVDGESHITTSFRDVALEELFSGLAECLKLYGHVVMQALIDRDNNVHIIECNSRFGGASTLSVELGLDSFYWFLLESTGVSVASYPFSRPDGEMKLVRFASDLMVPYP